jgi:hypothetical protein
LRSPAELTWRPSEVAGRVSVVTEEEKLEVEEKEISKGIALLLAPPVRRTVTLSMATDTKLKEGRTGRVAVERETKDEARCSEESCWPFQRTRVLRK